ncbi:MAG TPA: hypothetical protein VFA95_09570 [Gammaproteobacteria bacterium]|nr:hypothetical protein [Gammaproteobacteria bacterium]
MSRTPIGAAGRVRAGRVTAQEPLAGSLARIDDFACAVLVLA